MAEITASLVKSLREKTGAGMMECKAALTEANGDEAQAVEARTERMLALRRILAHQGEVGREKAHSSSDTSVGLGVRGSVSMPKMVRHPTPKVRNRL